MFGFYVIGSNTAGLIPSGNSAGTISLPSLLILKQSINFGLSILNISNPNKKLVAVVLPDCSLPEKAIIFLSFNDSFDNLFNIFCNRSGC